VNFKSVSACLPFVQTAYRNGCLYVLYNVGIHTEFCETVCLGFVRNPNGYQSSRGCRYNNASDGDLEKLVKNASVQCHVVRNRGSSSTTATEKSEVY
jgi:hypothetical protein